MKLLIRAPFTECERKRLESYFDEIVYDPWTRTGERYYEDEMLDALRKEQPDALITELIDRKCSLPHLEKSKTLEFVS